MKTTKASKTNFDCVTSKDRAQARIYRKIKGLNAERQAAYFDKAVREGPFADLWHKLVAQGRRAPEKGRMRPPAHRSA